MKSNVVPKLDLTIVQRFGQEGFTMDRNRCQSQSDQKNSSLSDPSKLVEKSSWKSKDPEEKID